MDDVFSRSRARNQRDFNGHVTHRGSRHSSTIAKIISLTGRNVRLYFIDRTSVFFSCFGLSSRSSS